MSPAACFLALTLAAGEPAAATTSGAPGAPAAAAAAGEERGSPETHGQRTLYRVRGESGARRGAGSAWVTVRTEPPALSLEAVDPFGRLRGLLYADADEFRVHLVAEGIAVETVPDARAFRESLGLEIGLRDAVALFSTPDGGGAPGEVRLALRGAVLRLQPRGLPVPGPLVRPPLPDSLPRASVEDAARLLLP